MDRGRFASLSSSLPLHLLLSSAQVGAAAQEDRRSLAASSAALVAGLLYFLLLPDVGCPLADAMCEYLLFSYLW